MMISIIFLIKLMDTVIIVESSYLFQTMDNMENAEHGTLIIVN